MSWLYLMAAIHTDTFLGQGIFMATGRPLVALLPLPAPVLLTVDFRPVKQEHPSLRARSIPPTLAKRPATNSVLALGMEVFTVRALHNTGRAEQRAIASNPGF